MFRYIKRHWRGEFSLPRSYWVNGVLIAVPLNVYFRVVTFAFTQTPPRSPSIVVEYLLLPTLLAFLLATWQGVGIWRSAGRRIAEGSPFWGWAARAVVLLNLALVLFAAFTSGRDAYSMVAAALEESTAHYDITDHGRFVVFHGVITDAGAARLEPLLSRPGTKVLVINGSVGGFVVPALELMKIIHVRDLMVVALSQCASSCTGLLAAAKIRAVSVTAAIGLHRGTMVGTTRSARGWKELETYYNAAGMTPQLFAKMRAHVGQFDVYEPTLRELIADGFVNRIYDQTAKAYFEAYSWCAANPLECDRTGRQNAATREH